MNRNKVDHRPRVGTRDGEIPSNPQELTDSLSSQTSLLSHMIDFLEMEASHVVGVRVSGKILSSDLDRAIQAIEEKLKLHDRVSFFVEIDDLSGMTPEAILKDLRYGIEQLKNLGRFYRAAVVTDSKWIRAAAGVEDLIIPKLEVKAFSKSDRDVATTWIGKLPAAV